MTTKTSTDKSTLLPLAYCAPKRAAALLACQVGDIYHWAACDEIALYFDANGYTNATKKHLMTDILSDFGMDLELGASAHLFSDVMRTGLIPIDYDPEDSIFLDEPFVLRGLWRIPCRLPRIWEHTEIVTLPEDELLGVSIPMLYAYKAKDDGASDRVLTGTIPIEVADFEQWIIILRDDLLLLEKHIASGEQFKPKPWSQQETMVAAGQPSPQSIAQTEIRAAARERVLAAAIHARELWPEACQETATSWADIVLDHEAMLFDTRKCPLTRDKVVAILAQAKKNGQPHKNT